jgi:hypothetical protein
MKVGDLFYPEILVKTALIPEGSFLSILIYSVTKKPQFIITEYT